MDDLWGNLEPVTGAASKRPELASQPKQQSMKAGIKPAQQKAPSGDQKKFRRQMNKRAAGTTCPNCGTAGDITDHGNHVQCSHCGFEFDPDTGTEYSYGGLGPDPSHTAAANQQTSHSTSTATKESTMTTSQTGAPTEADLLQRLAAATTLTQQAALAAQLDDLRATQREAAMAAGSLDWGAMDTPAQHNGPSAFAMDFLATTAAAQAEAMPNGPRTDNGAETYTEHLATARLSSASDWMMDEYADAVDDTTMTAAMRAQATLWYDHDVWAPVKESQQEFSVQAHNAAQRAGSTYGTRRTAAASVFLAQVQHLYKQAGYKTADWGKDPYDQPDGTTTDTYVSDGKTTTPVGTSPDDVKTFDEDTLPGGSEGEDPKTSTDAGVQQSLSEGDQPEGDKAESPENPLTGDKSDASAGAFVNDQNDKMKTQGARTWPEVRAEAAQIMGEKGYTACPNHPGQSYNNSTGDCSCGSNHHKWANSNNPGGMKQGGFFHKSPDAGGPMGQQSEWDSMAKQVREERERRQKQQANDGASAADHGSGVSPEEIDNYNRARSAAQDPALAGLAQMFASLNGGVEAATYEQPQPYATPLHITAGHNGVYLTLEDAITVIGGPYPDESAAKRALAADPGLNSGNYALVTIAEAIPSDSGLGAGIDEGAAPEGDHAEPATQNNGEGAKDESGDGQGWPTVPGTGGSGDATSGASPGTPYHSHLSSNAQVFVQTLSTMVSLDDSIGGISGHQIVALLLKEPDLPANLREALRGGANPFVRSGAKQAARECQWTRVSEPGEDDGLTWWECTTHGKTEMGGEQDPPDFPCEGWLDENAAERGPYTGSKQAGESSLLTDLPSGWSAKPNSQGTAVHTSGGKVSYEPGSGQWEAYAAAASDSDAPKSLGVFDSRAEAMAAVASGKTAGGSYAREPQGNPDFGWVEDKKVSPDEREKMRLSPNGIPLHGDLTPEQQAWLKRRSSLHTAVSVGFTGEGWYIVMPEVGTDGKTSLLGGPYPDKAKAEEILTLNAAAFYGLAGAVVRFIGPSFATTAARDTGTCGSCGRAVSYDSSDRKWTHDDGEDYGHDPRPKRMANLSVWAVADEAMRHVDTGKESVMRTTALGDPRSDYEKGKEVGFTDHSNSNLDLSHPSKTEEWNKASDEWKQGWNDGYSTAADRKSKKVPAQRKASAYVEGTQGRNMLGSIAANLHRVAYTDTFHGCPAIVEDAGDGMVTVTLPEGCPDLGYAPGSQFYHPADDPGLSSARQNSIADGN